MSTWRKDTRNSGGSAPEPPESHHAPLPRIERDGGRGFLLVDERPFVAMGAEVHNSNASSIEYMAGVWPRLLELNCNTVLVPVSWELLEPEPGRFDFQLVNGLLFGARCHGLRLILLWFGTWKNAESTYVPAWVKMDLDRYPRAQTSPGVNSRAISPFSANCRTADALAFAGLLRYLREHDPQHTVIMVQVENETGLLGASRDLSAPAQAAFHNPVPAAVTALLGEPAILHPELRAAWEAAGGCTRGSWPEVFGEAADEAFMAWYVASYVEAVASAGKAEMPLPMFANAWLNYGTTGGISRSPRPGEYPSGGPVARVHALWRTAAPDIDALAPDAYASLIFTSICNDFTRTGNPLVIPETAGDAGAAARVFWAVGEGALCFSPYGIEAPHPAGPSLTGTAPGLASSYALLSELVPVLGRRLGTGQVRGILQQSDSPESFEVGSYRIEVEYAQKLADCCRPAGGLIAMLGPAEFLVAGCGFHVRFFPPAGQPETVDFLSVDEGWFRDGQWESGRRMNGDDTDHRQVRMGFEPDPVIRRVRLYTHK